MSKSLKDVAKAVLMNEGAVPSVSASDNDPDRGAKSKTANAETLHPGTKYKEPDPKHNEAEDLGGATPTKVPTENLGARASKKKDTSKSSTSPVGSEPPKKLAEEPEETDEDVISEEDFEAFIDDLVQEGYSEDEIANIVSENFELDEESLDELNKSTLKAYRDRARSDVDSKEDRYYKYLARGRESGEARRTGPNFKKSDKISKQIKNRKRFIDKAELRMGGDFKNNKTGGLKRYNLQEDEESDVIDFIDDLVQEGYNEEEILQAVQENFSLETGEETMVDDTGPYSGISEDALQESFGSLQDKVLTKLGKESYEVNLSEEVAALLEGEELSEDFKKKAITIFEAAVNSRVLNAVQEISEAFEEVLREEALSLEEAFNNKYDEDMDFIKEETKTYLNHIAEQWISENEVAIESSLKTELTEEFISGLRNLFAEHYIDIPEEKVDVLDAMNEELENTKSRLDEEIQKNLDLTKEINEAKKHELLANISEDLTDVQAEKLLELAENVSFSDPDEFEEKLSTLKESYFPAAKPKSTNTPLDKAESGNGMIAESLDGPMAHYVSAIGRTNLK